MIWKETGVNKGSYMCFFNPPSSFKAFYYYMVSCGYFLCNESYEVRNDGNRPPLFFYIITGELKLDYQGKHYCAGSNDIVLLNCYRPQSYYCTSDCEFLFFHFDGNTAPELADHLIDTNGGPIFHLNNASTVYERINKPVMNLCYQEQVSDAALSSLVYSTLCLIQENSLLSSAFRSYSDPVTKVINYIDKNINQHFTLKELSSYVNLSPYHFSRIFKKETGYSPLEYVSVTKINFAKLALRTSDIAISELAISLGYSSSSSFINAFKAQRGVSPNRYRNEYYANVSANQTY